MTPPRRMATCGACGCQVEVTDNLKRLPRTWQYQRRPDEDTDLFYCGCQDDDHLLDPGP